MSVVHRGKRAHWPSAGAPAFSGSGGRGTGRSGAEEAAAERDAARRWLQNRDAGRSVAWFRRLARAIWNRCNHLNAPVVYPWSPSRGGTAVVHELHRRTAAMSRLHFGRGLTRLWLWTKACGWPLVALTAISPLLWRYGRHVRAMHGMTLGAQARDLALAVWRHGIFPTEYYHHRIFRVSQEVDRAHYLNEREIRALLRECARGAEVGRVNDLPRFMAECRLAGLPALRTPVVAWRGRTEFVHGVAAGTLPQRDLFLRPVRWSGSTAGQQWRWNAQTKAWMFRGESRSATGLLEHAARLAGTQPWVVHEAISNHPDIARFSAGGVCTARLATGLGPDGQPRILFAALHLPASTEGGCGPAPGELVAGVDVATGRLEVAMDEFVSDGEFPVHPGTGVMIKDAVVPQWAAFCDLALRAHQRFCDLPFAGWRIALSGGGPVLVEAGTDWGVFRHVWPAQTIFAEWCQRRLAELPPPPPGVV